MAGEYNDLGEVGAVTTHRLGEAGVDRLAGVVTGAVQEEDRWSELACIFRSTSVGGIVAAEFMYQESAPKKPVRASAAA